VQPNPNKEREAGHWISHDFGNTYRLGEAHIGNVNAPEILNQGFREFHIDYNTVGNAGKNLGFYAINQASGLSTNEGESIGSFSGDTARFVLLTEESNWGGACSGLAEVRIEVVEILARLNSILSGDYLKVSIYPNPQSGSFNFGLQSACEEAIYYALYAHTGKKVWAANAPAGNGFIQREIDTRALAPGMCNLVVIQGKECGRFPRMKL